MGELAARAQQHRESERDGRQAAVEMTSHDKFLFGKPAREWKIFLSAVGKYMRSPACGQGGLTLESKLNCPFLMQKREATFAH
jgi:hypothetical protein